MVRHDQDSDSNPDGLETKLIRINANNNQPEVVLSRYSRDKQPLQQTVSPWDQYDPRARPWYTGASASTGPFWTDVYPFFTNQTAGITATLAATNPDGQLQAVVGADVALADISSFLASIKIGKTGKALIVNDRGRVIAHPTQKLLRQNDASEVRLTQIADLQDAAVSRAFDRYQVQGHGRRDFILDDPRYISAALSLNHLLQRDRTVLVIVPEDDFVGFVVDNVSKTLMMGLGVIALASLLAAFMVRQGLRTDKDAIAIIERETRLDAEGDALAELAQHAQLFSDSNQSVEPVTEAIVQATRARRAIIWQLQDNGATLVCLDVFDQQTDGHTQGSRLQRKDHPQAFELLTDNKNPLATIDAAGNQALNSLAHQYLSPLGCNAILSAAVGTHQDCTGMLWLEDGSSRQQWPQHTQNFIQAIANLLAIRESASGKQNPATAVTDKKAPG